MNYAFKTSWVCAQEGHFTNRYANRKSLGEHTALTVPGIIRFLVVIDLVTHARCFVLGLPKSPLDYHTVFTGREKRVANFHACPLDGRGLLELLGGRRSSEARDPRHPTESPVLFFCSFFVL